MLPGEYASPVGALLLAFVDNAICEMKRLYVRPVFRGLGVGRRLATVVIEAARKAGYAKMRLDTVPAMVGGMAMCRTLGFVGILAYRRDPVEGTVFRGEHHPRPSLRRFAGARRGYPANNSSSAPDAGGVDAVPGVTVVAPYDHVVLPAPADR